MTHDVDVLLSAAHHGAEITLPGGWGQGRATFGGLVAGALTARTLGELGLAQDTLRSLTVNFAAPAESGDARIDVEVLRQGSSATQAQARLVQGESVRAVAVFTFGTSRPSAVEVAPALLSPSGRPDEIEPVPFVPGLAPDFLQHVDLRPATGGYPFSGSLTGDLTGYMRFSEPTEEFGLAHLVTLVDGWPPAPAQMLLEPAALATMTWTMEFVTPVPERPSMPWWYDVVTDAAHEGYAHTQARVADEDGNLVAISRQTIALFG